MYRIEEGRFWFNWTFLVKSFAFSVIMVSVAYTFLVVGPAVETTYFPVVETMHIDTMVKEADGRTAVYSSFFKRRACTYLGIAWYHGKRDQEFDRIPVETRRDPNDISSPTRPIGYQKSDPLLVPISPQEIVNNSFVELFHQCHLFWVTTTRYYP